MGHEVRPLQLKGSQGVKLQRIAERLAAAKQVLAEGGAEEDAVKRDFYELIDELAGPNTHVIYEARDPFASWRLAREISETRSFDVDGLKKDLPSAKFKSITRTEVDTKALDVALDRGLIDRDVVEAHTIKTPRARGPLWKPSAGDIRLDAGQLVVVE